MGPPAASDERVLRRRGTAPAASTMTAAGRKGRSSSAGSAAEMEIMEEPMQGGGRPKRAGTGARPGTAGIKVQPVQRSQSNPVGKSSQSLPPDSPPPHEGPAILRRGRAKRGKASSSQEGHPSPPPAPQDPTYASQYQEYQEGQGDGAVGNEDYPMEDARVGPGYEQYESDDSQRSSPAMSSAALALASMFHGQQGHEGEGVMGYAFPLEDSKQPPEDYTEDPSRASRKRSGEPHASSPTSSPGASQEGNGESPAHGYEGYMAGVYSAEGEPRMQMMPMAMIYEENENCRAQGNRPYRYTMGMNHHMKPPSQGARGGKKKGRKGQTFSSQSDAQMAAMWGKRKAMSIEPGQEEGAVPQDEQGQHDHQQAMTLGYVLGPDGQPQQPMYRGGGYDDPNYQHQMAACGHDTEEYDSSSGMQYQLSGAALGSYNRKEKSLGLLCENFIKRFSDPAFQDPEVGISLDRAATVLGVERRRIYDIINILESVCYVSRKCKNTYIWHGQVYLNQVLKQLQEEALELWPEDAKLNGLVKPADTGSEASQAKTGQKWTPDFGGGNVPEDRKEKSLGRLSQKFIQLFLIGYEVISLSGAAEKLLDATPGPSGNISDKGMKTKVRRLYDIANVLTSLRLIDKVQVPDSRKPSFRWVGIDPAALLTQTYSAPPPLPGIQETSKKGSRSSSGSNSSSNSSTSNSHPDNSPDMPPPAVNHGGHRAAAAREASGMMKAGSDEVMSAPLHGTATTKPTETPTRQLPPPPPPPPQTHGGPPRGMVGLKHPLAGELTPLSPDSMENYQMSQVHAYMQSYREEWNQWRTRRLHLGEQAGPPPAEPVYDPATGTMTSSALSAPAMSSQAQEGQSGGFAQTGSTGMEMSNGSETVDPTSQDAAYHATNASSPSYNGATLFVDQAAAVAPPEVSGPTVAV